MENFVISARKYRPKNFDSVVAQNSITSTLKNAIKNNQVAQAFIFCGPRGVGKTTCARILAKTINCENLDDKIEPCGVCAPCKSFNEYASFNIHELDAASNNSVDDIRSLVDQVRIPPQVGKYKIYIIDEVHMLSQSAFNAFLKTLEEPPSYAKFILATTEKHKIIPTILSRCQIYDFKRISVEDIVKYLEFVSDKENVVAEHDALHVIAQKADGAMRDALTIFDQLISFSGKSLTYQNVIDNLNVLDIDYHFRLTDYIFNSDISSALLLLDDVIDKGFDGMQFMIGFSEHLRNILVCKDKKTIQLLEVSNNVKGKYDSQSDRCEFSSLLKALNIMNKCDINYRLSNNKRLLLELTLLELCNISANKQNSITKDNIIETTEKKNTQQPNKPESLTKPQINSQLIQESQNIKTTPASQSTQPLKPNIISINPVLKKKSVEEINQVEEPNVQLINSTNSFSQEEFIVQWKKYAENIAKLNPSLNATLTNQTPVLKDNFIIELPILNSAQEDEIKQKRTDILSFLRKSLNNNSIELKTIITDKPENDKPYTPQDKFQKMNEINPALSKFKEQLGLDIDY